MKKQSFHHCYVCPDVEQGFLPWLMEQVTSELDRSELGRLVLDGMLREVVQRRMEVYKALDEQLHPTTVSRAASKTPSVANPADDSGAPATTTAATPTAAAPVSALTSLLYQQLH